MTDNTLHSISADDVLQMNQDIHLEHTLTGCDRLMRIINIRTSLSLILFGNKSFHMNYEMYKEFTSISGYICYGLLRIMNQLISFTLSNRFQISTSILVNNIYILL